MRAQASAPAGRLGVWYCQTHNTDTQLRPNTRHGNPLWGPPHPHSHRLDSYSASNLRRQAALAREPVPMGAPGGPLGEPLSARSSAQKSSARHPGVNPAIAKQAGLLLEQQMSSRRTPQTSTMITPRSLTPPAQSRQVSIAPTTPRGRSISPIYEQVRTTPRGTHTTQTTPRTCPVPVTLFRVRGEPTRLHRDTQPTRWMNQHYIWAWNGKRSETGEMEWPRIQGQANLHSKDQITHQPQNQPELYNLNPDVGVELMADLSPSMSRSTSPMTYSQRQTPREMREQAQRGYDGNLTTLSTPDSPTRRHELRHYSPAPWMPASPTGKIIGHLDGQDPSAWRGRRKEADERTVRASPGRKPRAQRHSALEQGQKVVDQKVTVTGIGLRVRDIAMDDYGGARMVWRAASPGREVKTASPFRKGEGHVKHTENTRSATKMSRAKPWGSPEQGRKGDQGPESPQFGHKAKQSPTSAASNNSADQPVQQRGNKSIVKIKKGSIRGDKGEDMDDHRKAQMDRERMMSKSPITIKPVFTPSARGPQTPRKAESDHRKPESKDDRDDPDRRRKDKERKRADKERTPRRDEYEDDDYDRSSKAERAARRDR